MIETARGDGVAKNVVFRLSRPDGSTRVVESTAYTISLAGENLVLGVVEDITARARPPRV